MVTASGRPLIPEPFIKEGDMSLFSSTYDNALTQTPEITAPAGCSGEQYAIFRLLSMSVVLSLMMVLTAVSIFVVHLQPVPSFPGTQIGENRNVPRFVQALDTLQPNSPVIFISPNLKGGDLHDSRC